MFFDGHTVRFQARRKRKFEPNNNARFLFNRCQWSCNFAVAYIYLLIVTLFACSLRFEDVRGVSGDGLYRSQDVGANIPLVVRFGAAEREETRDPRLAHDGRRQCRTGAHFRSYTRQVQRHVRHFVFVRKMLRIARFRLKGVPIALGPIKPKGSLAHIIDDHSCMHLDVTANLVVFVPKIGATYEGSLVRTYED